MPSEIVKTALIGIPNEKVGGSLCILGIGKVLPQNVRFTRNPSFLSS